MEQNKEQQEVTASFKSLYQIYKDRFEKEQAAAIFLNGRVLDLEDKLKEYEEPEDKQEGSKVLKAKK